MKPQNYSVEAAHIALHVLRMLRPHGVKGFSKKRLGRFFDGGYVMLDNLSSVDIAYSLGINDDVSWDLDIAARGIKIFQYDHTIDRIPVEHELFSWHKIGIADRPDPEKQLESLQNLIHENGHSSQRNMILKCDIEGGEWPLFSEISNKLLSQFSQIVMEVHYLGDLHDLSSAHTARRAIENLTTSHRLVHVHANNYAPWAVVGGIPIPEMLELTFARLDIGEFFVSHETFPTIHDMPNDRGRADFFLGKFTFD